MRKNAVLYPFCEEALPAVKLFDRLQEKYVTKYLVAPSGFGYTGRDAGDIRNHPKIGMEVLSKMPFEKKDWETLIVFEPAMKQGDFFLVDCMREAVAQGREVLYICAQEDSLPYDVRKMAQNHREQIEIKSYPIVENDDEDQGLHEPEVPVVLVGGLLEEADCFEVFAALAEKFRQEGERVAAFSKHPLGSLFGFFGLDHIWNSTDDTEEQKIRKINSYINTVARKYATGIILLEAPDALMKYNDSAQNGFGIRSYMLCQSVTPDYLIGCIPFDVAESCFIDAIGKDFTCRLGCGLTGVHVSNVLLDTMDTMQKKRVEVLYADEKFVLRQLEKQRKECFIPMFDVIEEGIEGLYEEIRSGD